VQTNIVNGVKFTLNIRERNCRPFYLEFADRSWGHLVDLDGSYERHFRPPCRNPRDRNPLFTAVLLKTENGLVRVANVFNGAPELARP